MCITHKFTITISHFCCQISLMLMRRNLLAREVNQLYVPHIESNAISKCKVTRVLVTIWRASQCRNGWNCHTRWRCTKPLLATDVTCTLNRNFESKTTARLHNCLEWGGSIPSWLNMESTQYQESLGLFCPIQSHKYSTHKHKTLTTIQL